MIRSRLLPVALMVGLLNGYAVIDDVAAGSVGEAGGLEVMLMTYAYGVTSVRVKTHYFFDDGRVCSCTELAPADARQSLSERGADEIGEWQADGERYRVRWPGKAKWKTIKKPLRAATVPRDWQGGGKYQSIGTSGGVTTSTPEFFVGAWSDLALNPDGTFAKGGGAMSTSDGSDGTNVSTTMGRQDAVQEGSYAIDGYSLTLSFADGRKERTSIAWDGVAKEGEDPYETLWIGGTAFKKADGS